MSRTLRLASLLVLFAACSSSSHAEPDASVPIPDAAPDAAPDAPLPPPVDACVAAASPAPVDCAGTTCAAIEIADDPVPTERGFRGFADPSLRKDPASSRVWLGYSFVRPVPFDDGMGRTQSTIQVETHLAHSDDAGASWTRDKVLFPNTPVPTTPGFTGFFNSETIGLAPASASSWFASRLAYAVQTFPNDGIAVSTFMVRISHAAAPDQLGASPEQVIGLTSSLPAGFGAATDLNKLSGLSCPYWNDPGLFYRNGTLYLTAQCVGLGTIHVFAAAANPDVSKLVWTDRGALTTPADALELGDVELNQADLTEATDGTVLLTVTPSHVTPGETLATHAGCRTLVVDSLDPPALHRECGALTVRAAVTASDVSSTGSCGSDPHTTGVGLVLARRGDGINPGQLVRSRTPD